MSVLPVKQKEEKKRKINQPALCQKHQSVNASHSKVVFSLKAVDTISTLKIIVSIKPYLVTSNGELLIV